MADEDTPADEAPLLALSAAYRSGEFIADGVWDAKAACWGPMAPTDNGDGTWTFPIFTRELWEKWSGA